MIQEKDFLYRVPVKNVLIKTPMQQARNPEILVDLEGGEFMHGNILDANSTNKLVSQSVKDAVDNEIIEGGYVTKDLLEKEVDRATKKEDSLNTLIENETNVRSSKDTELENSIAEEKTRAQSKEKEISDLLAIVNGSATTEGSFRKAIADLIDAAPEDFDTLKEIADKLASDDNLHTTILDALNTKYDSNNIPVASKELLGIAKVGDGLNVNAGVISIAPDYLVDMMSYGVEWDITVADPTCTRIGNPLFHKSLPIQSEYKGCVVKNGKLQYYLNPNDWLKKSNGEPSHLDGTDGDVMIHTPKFYGKSGSNGNKRWVRISTVKVDASWVEIPEMFISAYRITTFVDSDKDKVASVVNTTEGYRGGGDRANFDQYLSTDKFRTDLGKPRTCLSRAQARTMANNSGQELLCYEFYKWIFYWNYVIEYANFNSQKEFNSELTSDGYHQGGLGPGLTTWDYNQWNTYNGNYAITPCGYTNEFGNFSGAKAIQLQSPEKTLYANRWRGFENPFGDIWTNLEGIIIKRDTAKANSNVYTTTDVSKYCDDYSLFDIAGVEIAQDGYIRTFDLGSKAEIIPSSITGSESTYKCDCHWCDADLVGNRTLMVGGAVDYGSQAGLGSFLSFRGVDEVNTFVGYRSLVRV